MSIRSHKSKAEITCNKQPLHATCSYYMQQAAITCNKQLLHTTGSYYMQQGCQDR
ncbi:hypothetical protein SAMN04487833_12826 [Sarcina sp. DSM 11001]|nr:hypothetical protein SAMN04487833_12826 [Sarcina sp. DSM 11001]